LPAYEVSAWDAVFAPAGTPAPIIAKLNAAIRRVLEEPELAESLLKHGAQVAAGTPDELARHVASETSKWAIVVRQSGAKID
jgi:tripartite-type tricarboxylate transporter receptor subunit TctC